jgi:hypothetical protein
MITNFNSTAGVDLFTNRFYYSSYFIAWIEGRVTKSSMRGTGGASTVTAHRASTGSAGNTGRPLPVTSSSTHHLLSKNKKNLI